jgi:branched-chain amino acid transport system permease protein
VTIPSLHVLSNALLSGILLGGLLAVTAVGLSLVFGVMRLINLAHGEILVLGAYLSLELSKHWGVDPLLSILIIAPALFVVAMPVFRLLLMPVLDRGPEPAMLTTFALAIIGQSLFVIAFTGDSQSLPGAYVTGSFEVLGIRVSTMYLVAFIIGVTLCVGLDLLVRRTAFGRDVRAASEDSEAAEGLGVDIRRTHLVVFGIAAACAGIGGVLVGATFSFTPTAGLTYLLTGFAVVVLGGLGSVRGTLVGAIGLGVAESVGGAFFGDGYRDVIGFAVFLIVLGVRPQGLFARAVFA